jgi:hypothetical protein
VSSASVIKRFDSKRCHCGDYIIAVDNNNDLNPDDWRWCRVCVQRKFCRENDRCPNRHEIEREDRTWLLRYRLDYVFLLLDGLAFIALIIFALLNQPIASALSGFIGAASDALLVFSKSPYLRELRKWKTGTLTRSLLRISLVLAAVFFSHDVIKADVNAYISVVAIVIVTYLLRLLYSIVLSYTSSRARGRVGWYRINMPQHRLMPHIFKTNLYPYLSIPEIVIWGLLALSIGIGSDTALLTGSGAMLLVLLVVIYTSCKSRLKHSRQINPETRALLNLTVQKLAAEVTIHHARTTNSTNIEDFLMELKENISLKRLTVLRELSIFERFNTGETPALLLPRLDDVEVLLGDQRSLMLYFGYPLKNDHALRLNNFLHCYVDLGDDEIAPAFRSYNEIWVKDEDRKAQYLALNEGFREEQLVVAPVFRKIYDDVTEHGYLMNLVAATELNMFLSEASHRAKEQAVTHE